MKKLTTTMKHSNHKSIDNTSGLLILAFIALIAALFIFSLSSCKRPNEHINLVVNSGTLAKSPVLLHFANANNSSANQPDEFDVKISGKDSALVQLDGGATTGFKASHGFLPLSLTSMADPSPTNPITFNVSANVPGFAPIVQTVTITKDTSTIVDVAAVEYNAPPKGTSVMSHTSSLSAGVSEGLTMNVPASSGMVESATITIPEGTQMMDAGGSAIDASKLTSNVVNYSALSPTSYGAFPGGFNPSNVLGQDGKLVNGGNQINFVSAGLISIKMTADGTPVHHFSKPLQVSMKLDPTTTNFVTGAAIQAGDSVPLWSLTEETGQWKSEGNVTITKDGGNLVANFTTTHLCCFNLDWTWAIAGISYGTCNHTLTVRIHCGAGKAGTYDVVIATPRNQYLAGAHGEFVHDGDVVVFPNVPDIAQAKIVISDFNLYLNPALPILAETGLFNPCSQGSIDISFGAPALPDFINVNLAIKGHCSNKNIDILPFGWFYLYDATAAQAGQNPWTYVYVRNGIIRFAFGTKVVGANGKYSIILPVGHQFHIYAFNSRAWYESSIFTLARRNFTLPAAGSGITGTVVYDAPGNALNISAVFGIHCN